jgi:hypothetical protein
MANISWKDSTTLYIALVDNVPVCELRPKDIGGVTASWLNDSLWAPPGHLPKAAPQQTRFFFGVAEAKAAVEEVLSGSA